MADILKHFLSDNGNPFVAVFASDADAEHYVPPAGAVPLPDAPGIDYDWINGQWVKREETSRYRSLPRPSFLFMMNKLGISEAQVEALIGTMPDATEAEADAKALALIVFRNQQIFHRDNELFNALATDAGLSQQAIDAAWRAAENLTW